MKHHLLLGHQMTILQMTEKNLTQQVPIVTTIQMKSQRFQKELTQVTIQKRLTTNQNQLRLHQPIQVKSYLKNLFQKLKELLMKTIRKTKKTKMVDISKYFPLEKKTSSASFTITKQL
jgi:hypothetical protein